jgi:hypothetical protein
MRMIARAPTYAISQDDSGPSVCRASEDALFAQELPRRLATDGVLLSHPLDRLEELYKLLFAHKITVKLLSTSNMKLFEK